MKKIEAVWRELLFQSIECKKFVFTQKELSLYLKVSVSTIHQALIIPRKLNAIRVTGRDFEIIHLEKILYLWATVRDPLKEVVYKTFVPVSAAYLEGLLPPGTIFTGYSGFKEHLSCTPAEYDHVYCYSQALLEIKKRCPFNPKQFPNLWVLKPDARLSLYLSLPLAQIFVDIWNFPEWYAKDFISEFRQRYVTILE